MSFGLAARVLLLLDGGNAVRIAAVHAARSHATPALSAMRRTGGVHMAEEFDVEQVGQTPFMARMISEALKGLSGRNSTAPLRPFTFSTKARSLATVEGRELFRYMVIPVEEYAVYDPKLMTRISSDVFELSLPIADSSTTGGLALQPTLRVRVSPPLDDSIVISSISGRLFAAADDDELGAALAAAEQQSDAPSTLAARTQFAESNLAKVAKSISLAFNTTLRWKARPGAANRTVLACATSVRFSIDLPPPFTWTPKPLITVAANTAMRSVCELVLPQFVKLLLADYRRWLNGTRTDDGEAVGSLMAGGGE